MLIGAQIVLFWGLMAILGGLGAVCFVLGMRSPT